MKESELYMDINFQVQPTHFQRNKPLLDKTAEEIIRNACLLNHSQ
jgi:hypothetical protein